MRFAQLDKLGKSGKYANEYYKTRIDKIYNTVRKE